jgi:hypothetical protein
MFRTQTPAGVSSESHRLVSGLACSQCVIEIASKLVVATSTKDAIECGLVIETSFDHSLDAHCKNRVFVSGSDDCCCCV